MAFYGSAIYGSSYYGSGVLYTLALTDTTGITDDIHGIPFPVLWQDTAGLTDIVIRATSYNPAAITDTTGLTDSVVASKGLVQTITDSAGSTDVSLRSFERAITDNEQLIDAAIPVSGSTNLSPSFTDLVGLVDQVQTTVTRGGVTTNPVRWGTAVFGI